MTKSTLSCLRGCDAVYLFLVFLKDDQNSLDALLTSTFSSAKNSTATPELNLNSTDSFFFFFFKATQNQN